MAGERARWAAVLDELDVDADGPDRLRNAARRVDDEWFASRSLDVHEGRAEGHAE
jgi:hypothetical protein